MKIYLIIKDYNKRIKKLIKKYPLQHDENANLALIIDSKCLSLYDRSQPNIKSIKVDFTEKKNYYRCIRFQNKNEILYKAIGIKKNYFPYILDATAGLGKDAFLLSYIGCKVTMVESNPIVAALLHDGLQRAYNHEIIGNWLTKRLNLIFNNSLNMLNFSINSPDVVYLDPMYPFNRKKCLPKKNMQFLRKIIKSSNNHYNLLYIARKTAKKRVIVKRPVYAKPISKDKIDFVITNKSYRFDIYLPI